MEGIVPIASCVIAVLALLISACSFWWSYRTSVRPVLVFFNDEFSPEHKTTWSVQNVGNGPALNVVLCGGKTLQTLDESVCAILPALAPGAKERLSFVKTRLVFVATYSDLRGVKYTSTCSESINVFSSRNRFPRLKPNLPLSLAKSAGRQESQPSL